MTGPLTAPDRVEFIGGGLTHFDRTRDAYSRPAPGLSVTELRSFGLGNRVFNTRWVEAPASVSGFDGLGPLFIRDSCSGCHLRDGRGRPPHEGESDDLASFVVKVSARSKRARRRLAAEIGPQLHTAAISGVAAEGILSLEYVEVSGTYADGSLYSLRAPVLKLRGANAKLPRDLELSLRVAPAVFGLGLIEAVAASAILEHADPDDLDGDGVSGRPNWVSSLVHEGQQVGRFGWKAGAATLTDQAAMAALDDIGLTSSLLPRSNCAPSQDSCREMFQSGQADLSDRLLDSLVGYLRLLGVPARTAVGNIDSLERGYEQFTRMGCALCHRPAMVTDDTHPLPLLRDQTFFPYSDFLLHDMGPGLAGVSIEGIATQREWRTPPLWGIGLLEQVNGHTLLLHDGRARSIEEAILWHGGEGKSAREAFRKSSTAQRSALVEFVQSL